jgi:hypothetical protein
MKRVKTLIRATIFIILTTSTAQAADIPRLAQLFQQNFNSFYQPRYCGPNTARFANAAQKLNIDLSNSYVLRLVGGGFWETSGFYTRNSTTERDMLGYFHMVFVADNYVFDFDLHEPLVLPLEDYIRLQLTPSTENSNFWGKSYKPHLELPNWEMTRYKTDDYARNVETVLDKTKLKDFVDLNSVLNRKRLK